MGTWGNECRVGWAALQCRDEQGGQAGQRTVGQCGGVGLGRGWQAQGRVGQGILPPPCHIMGSHHVQHSRQPSMTCQCQHRAHQAAAEAAARRWGGAGAGRAPSKAAGGGCPGCLVLWCCGAQSPAPTTSQAWFQCPGGAVRAGKAADLTWLASMLCRPACHNPPMHHAVLAGLHSPVLCCVATLPPSCPPPTLSTGLVWT